MTEIGWTDQHDYVGHIVVGRAEVLDYAPPCLGREWLDEDVVAIIEVTPADGEIDYSIPVYVPRAIAEIIANALQQDFAR